MQQTASTWRRAAARLATVLALVLGAICAPGFSTAGRAAGVPTIFVTNGQSGTVTEYGTGAHGNVSPAAELGGSNTGLNNPTGVAVDAAGEVFVVARLFPPTVSVFEPANGTAGNVAPIRSISGVSTGMFFPEGLAVDAAGDLFVANGGGSVTEFAPGANGNASPIATISGPTSGITGANSPFGIALDPSGDIFVSLLDNSIAEYAPGANGDVAPIAVIAGAKTQLNQPDGLAIAFGNLYAANTNNSVTEYPLQALGTGTNDLVPSALIAGAATGINNPQGIAVDGSGTLYVVNYVQQSASTVTAFAPTANGNASPSAVITGSNTGLATPAFVAVPPVQPVSALTVTTPGLPAATVSTPYSRYLAAGGGTAPYTWSIVNGYLPAGLMLDAASGHISGTPTTSGASTFTVQVIDSTSTTASKPLTLSVEAFTPLAVATSQLPSGIQGTFYEETLAAAGGSAPYSWSITSGSLPGGLSLNPGTGQILGTPTSAGTFGFTVSVADSSSAPGSVAKPLSIAVTASHQPQRAPEIIYVANCPNNSITEYPVGASGDVAPLRTIAGPGTGLNCPFAVWLDSSNNLYVTNNATPGSVTVYAPGANGNARPIRTITGPATQLGGPHSYDGPRGLTVDSAGDVFVTQQNSDNMPPTNEVLEFSPGANGNTAPIATIVGPHTQLQFPVGITVDQQGHIFVTNFGDFAQSHAGGGVVEYAPGASGDVAPILTIPADQPGMVADGVVPDHAGHIFVTEKEPPEIIEYALTGSGHYAKVRVIGGPVTNPYPSADISYPALDASGHIFVTDFSINQVREYSPHANGDVAPIAVIAGPATGQAGSQGLVIGPPA